MKGGFTLALKKKMGRAGPNERVSRYRNIGTR
jgi:hypothetical protein